MNDEIVTAADALQVQLDMGCTGQLAQLAHVLKVEQVEQHDEQVEKFECAKVPATPEMEPVRKNIVIDSGAFIHALSWIFSRQEFLDAGFPASHGFGRDGLVRKAGRMAESMFLTSRPPDARKNANGGFQSHSGAEIHDHHYAQNGHSGHHARQSSQLTRTTHCHRGRAYPGAFSCSQRRQPCRCEALHPRHVHAEAGLRRIEEWRCSMNAAINTQSAKAHRSALLCFALALLTMATTAWFVVEGINATEPDSPARWAKVASGVLLLVLEASAFGLAGQWPEHSKVLRALGWSVLALEITLMSVAQVSIGMTAAKSSSGGDTTISALEKKSAGARENAKRLQSRADELRATGRTANIRLAASEEKAAIKQTAIADEAETDAQKRRSNSTGTPIVEIVGKGGLIGLSIALSVALSLSGIVLMHVAGSLWRRASGALPVDVQILELLQRIHGAAPVAPVQAAEIVAPAPVLAAPVAPVPAPAPVPASFKTVEPIEPKDYSTGLAYSSKIKLAGAGLLGAAGALIAPITHAAPAVPTQAKAPSVPAVAPANGASETVQSGASETLHSGHDATSFDAAPTVPTAGQPRASETMQAGASETVQPATKKPRAKRAVSAKIDTGTDGVAGARYLRVKAGVKAGKIRPSLRGIQAIEGGSQDVVSDYLRQLETEGVIVKKGRGYVLAEKYQALLAKKGGAK